MGVGRGTSRNYRESKGAVSQESLGTDVVVVNTVEKCHRAISAIVSASCWPHSVLGSVPISSSCGFPAWVTSAFFSCFGTPSQTMSSGYALPSFNNLSRYFLHKDSFLPKRNSFPSRLKKINIFSSSGINCCDMREETLHRDGIRE